MLGSLLGSVLLCCTPFVQGTPCPRGADYRAQLLDARGASAVAWIADDLLVAVPEAVTRDSADKPAPSLKHSTQILRVRNARSAANAALPPTANPQPSSPAPLTLPGHTLSGSAWEPFAAVKAQSVTDLSVSTNQAIAVADADGVVFVRLTADAPWSEVGRGTLVRPQGVAWYRDMLLVSDAGLQLVLAFDAEGRERARLGAGQLLSPAGLDADANGSVFVADQVTDCLWRFELGDIASRPSTETVATVAGSRLGESGANPGQFSSPRDVLAITQADGRASCLLVADELNHRVQVVAPSGAFIGYFGMHALLPRQGEGRIHYPSGLAVAADGVTLAIAEPFEDRVQFMQLKPEPDPVDPSVTGAAFISSHFGSEIGCGNDILVLIDREIEAIAICDARDPVPTHMSVLGGAGALPMRFGEISAIAVVPTDSPLGPGDIWVADRVHGRLDAFSLVWDRTKQSVFDQFLPKLKRSINLRTRLARSTPPAGATLWKESDITDIAFEGPDAFLLDRGNMAILRMDARATRMEAIPLPSTARQPEELAVWRGRFAIADPVMRAVFVREPDGAWRTLHAIGETPFVRPSGVAFLQDGAADGRLVVADAGCDALIVEEADGTARIIGERGVLDEQFWDLQGIAMSPRGLIVIDRGNHRYERFGDELSWNLTGTLGRYYDRKRRGSPGAPPLDAPASTPDARKPANTATKVPLVPKEDS